MEFEEFDIEFLAMKMAENPQSMLFARLADLYLGKEQTAEAMKLLEDGIKTYPEYFTGYIVLGKTHLALKEYSRAQTAFQKAIELSPFNQTAAKLLISVPNKPDESTRTTDENYFSPSPQTSGSLEYSQQYMQTEDPQQMEVVTNTVPFISEEPSLLEQLQAEEDARLRAEAEAGTVSDSVYNAYSEPEVQQPSYEESAYTPTPTTEAFPSYDEYFAQNQSRINSQDPVSLDEYLNTEQTDSSSFVSEQPVQTRQNFTDDPFTTTASFDQPQAHVDPEPVFANPEQAALFAEMNAMNEEFPSSATPPASLDIDSIAEKLQSAEKIIPQENYQPQNPVPKETQDDQAYETDAVTPTLAEIYASQGEYRAAIQAYEILMFSVPAKGGEYQQRIRELQQLQMEKDGLI